MSQGGSTTHATEIQNTLLSNISNTVLSRLQEHALIIKHNPGVNFSKNAFFPIIRAGSYKRDNTVM